MESTETLQFDFERTGPSRRRISSILKAPRTSVKMTESDQKENQGHKSQPLEKRRSSRRVSFAATKDVIVFSKDMTSSSEDQSPSPSSTSTGTNSRDAKAVFDGIENLLTAPLQVPRQREKVQFFADPVLTDEKTVLFGDDTACMDMTQCHTVLIDKDSDKSGMNFSINTDMSLSRIGEPAAMEDDLHQKSRCLTDMRNTYSQSTKPTSDFGAFLADVSEQKGAGSVKTMNREGDASQRDLDIHPKADKEAAFGMFLASLSKPNGPGIKATHAESRPAVQCSSPMFMTPSWDSEGFLAKIKKTRHGVIDKENQPFTTSGYPVSKPQGFHLEKSSIPSAESETMDLKQRSVAVFLNSPGPDAMDFTKSHTGAINFKSKDVVRPSLSNAQRADGFVLDPNKTHFFTDNGMELTEVIQEQGNVHENTIRQAESGQQQKMVNFQKGLCTVDSADGDDMEVTKCQTVVIDTKGFDGRPSKTRKSLSANRSVMFIENEDKDGAEAFTSHRGAIDGRGFLPNQQAALTEKPSAIVLDRTNSPGPDDMDFTKSHTGAINFKSKDVMRPSLSNAQRADGFVLDPNKTHVFTDTGMEFTGVIQEQGNVHENTTQVSVLGAPSSGQQQKMLNFQKGLCSVDSADADDMEVTKCQTVVIDTKGLDGRPSKTRKSISSNRSVMFTQNDDKDGAEASPGPDDMDFTKSHTGAINFKSKDVVRPSLSNAHRADGFVLDPNKTHVFSDTGMEFTGVIQEQGNEQKQGNAILRAESRLSVSQFGVVSVPGAPSSGQQQKILNFQKALCTDSPDADDMEVTKCQTVTIDTKGLDGRPSNTRKSLSANRSVMFTQNDDKDGAEAFTRQTEASQLCIPGSISMALKNRRLTGPGLSSSVMDITGVQSDLTESNPSFKGSVLRNSRSLSVPSSLRNTMLGEDPYPERETAAAHDEMEITRCQTVNIDAKHKMISRNDDPKGHIQTTECKNSILPMTNETLASIKMTGQASKLQISTACEDQGFTTDKATVIDSNPTGETDCHKMTTKKFFPFESLTSKPCESEEVITDLSFVTGQKRNFFPSLSVNDVELTSGKHVTTDSQVMRKSISCMEKESRSQSFFKEGHDMTAKLSETFSQEQYEPLHQEENPVAPMFQRQQREVGGESSHTSSVCEDGNVDSGKPHGIFPTDSVTNSNNLTSQKTKSRRRSLLDLQTKLRRISQTINNDLPQIEVPNATAPLPCMEVTEKMTAEPETADTVGHSQQQTVEVLSEGTTESSRVAPLSKHETKPLKARFSLGGFVAKLPSRPKPVTASHETTTTFKFNIFETEQEATSNLPSNFQEDDINAEEFPEMSSEEDISEDYSVRQTKVEDSHCSVDLLPDDLEDDVFLTGSVTRSQKRPYPESGHDQVPLEPKRKQDVLPSDLVGSASSGLQWDTNNTEEASNVMTKTIDGTGSSNNSTYLKSEATLESTYKHSQCDSQIDRNLDYEFDYYKKIEDGSITVNEFLKYFGIDIVIHRSRPSALPDNFSPKQGPKLEHLLKEAYIYRPKQKVYEADCGRLTDMVDSLKLRMKEQGYPLKHINDSLLQELANLSMDELQSFGSKLKERKVYFRKKSKMTLHEMKAGMYSELVHTTLEAKQKLEEKLLETDTLLKDLDACISDLEGEVAAVESALKVDQVHAQTDRQPTLKKKQEELNQLDGAVDERRRQMVNMESEKKNKAEKLDRLREEIKDIEKHTSILNSLNEWKLSLKEDGRTLFSFLHNTLLLEVVHDPSTGVLVSNDSEQKLLDISFKFQLDAENPESRTVMVHDLLSQILKSETGTWLKRYSTTRSLPMLLHDVSLAVSRKRLLGEEIQRLERWGALRLDILEISCADRRVQVLFSSLKALAKFRLTLAVTCAYPFGGVTIHDFQNYIGNTRVEQIEDVLSSIEPANGYLIKIIKKIHDRLLV